MASFNAEMRMISRVVAETSKGIKRTRWMNFVIISTMAAILSIFGCLFRTSLAISHFVEELGNSLEISVYVKPGRSPEEISKEIIKTKLIKDIKIVTKEQAWEDLKKQMEIPEIKNPLPDTVRVKVLNKESVPVVIEKIKTMDSVEGTQYAKQLAEKISNVGDFTNVGIIVIVIVLGGLTLSIINNTIHLVIQSRKQEIEIMRMMGVGNGYIRAPYILQGAFYGLCGGGLSLIPILMLTSYISKVMFFFNIQPYMYYTNLSVIGVILMGVVVGGLGSVIAVRKYLSI